MAIAAFCLFTGNGAGNTICANGRLIRDAAAGLLESFQATQAGILTGIAAISAKTAPSSD
jgi:hypothetical protein